MREIDYSDAPVFSREKTFKRALGELYSFTENPTIAEVGCTREVNDLGAGNSSELFAWAVTKYGGGFYTCDISPVNASVCSKVIRGYSGLHRVFCMDGVQFLTGFKGPIDLLYLDSMDADAINYMPSAKHHVDLFEAALSKLMPGALILIDDIFDTQTFVGKGFLLIPLLIEKGYEVLERDYQFLFRVK